MLSVRSLSPILAALVVCWVSLLGGCAQRMAVEGRSDRLYAEAKGALQSEGFSPVGRVSVVSGATGCDPRSGRLQFLYYGDTISPTVVEVQITASEFTTEVNNQKVSGRARAGTTAVATQTTDGNGNKEGQPSAPVATPYSPVLLGAHQVIVKAWSSMTFAPDPFIADLAMGVLRRAYSLSGNSQ